MNINEMKALLDTTDYDFLRIEDHCKHPMLLVPSGSYAYGTNHENSDFDLRGICEPLPKEIIGLSEFEQYRDENTDSCIYSFLKIIPMLMTCNPDVITMLGTDPEHILVISEEGKMLRNHLNLFISQRAGESFSGYMIQQLRGLENAIVNDNYPQNEKEKHILATLNHMMNSLMIKYDKMMPGSLKLYLDKSNKEFFDQEIFMDVTLNHYPMRDFKNIYSEMDNVIRDFGKLKKRNKKKDIFHLNKHKAHLIRACRMGYEILSGMGIRTNRTNIDADALKDILHGKLTDEEFSDLLREEEAKFQYAFANTTLPERCDINKIEELVMAINTRILKKY